MRIREGQTFFELHFESGEVGHATGNLSVDDNGGRGANVRNRGQVATPREIADAMAAWVVTPEIDEVMDPAAGLGHLLHACARLKPDLALTAIESDPAVFREAKNTAPPGTKLVLADYLRTPPGKHGAIIANPPYVKSQRMGLTEGEWRVFDEMFETRLGRQTNLYALFILKIWQDLANGGRAAVIVPAEFLNANFGVTIKERILAMRPAGLAIFSPDVSLFNKTLTTSAVLFLEKGRPEGEVFHGVKIQDAAELLDFVGLLQGDHSGMLRTMDMNRLKPSEKWLNGILATTGQTSSPSSASDTFKLGDFFKCSRGIATGANDFFCLKPSEIDSWGLSHGDFDPCVTKAADLPGWLVDETTFESLQAADKRCHLLNPGSVRAPVRKYLDHGMELGVHERHLPSKRPVWYLPERRKAPAILAPVFTRGRVQFILNRANLRSLTCFHGLVPKPGFDHLTPLVWIFLNSRGGQQAFQKVNRFYGNGLNKLEPKDVEDMPCPDFSRITPEQVKAFLTNSRWIESASNPDEKWFDQMLEELGSLGS